MPDDALPRPAAERGPSARVLAATILGPLVVLGLVVILASAGEDGTAASPSATGQSAKAGTVPTARVNRFDPRRALAVARRQVDAGLRPAGSSTLRRLAVGLRDALPDGHFEDVPGHPGLRNVVGSLPGPGPVIVIGAHYDSENHPPGFVGANDAAAAVGTVVELSRAIGRLKRTAIAPGLRFVLFDGEEEPAPTDDFYADALRGSKAYVQLHAEEIGSMVLLDYIGGKGVRLPREGSSTRELWDRVRAAAQDVGVGAVFPDRTQTAIFDDHTPFLRAGIGAVDLIDWSYRYKDTTADTWDKLSSASVDAVGETIVQLVHTWPDV